MEKDLNEDPILKRRCEEILSKLSCENIFEIDSYEKVFGKFRKPYLAKRSNLNLFLARKKGELIKKTPNAYGYDMESPHYYHVHQYNCIFECEYCYLQGYFPSPDIVLFLNHEEIISEMKTLCKTKTGNVWFHAGEFSDSLALAHISNELGLYSDFIQDTPNAFLELRTKSVNLRGLKNVIPDPRLVIGVSLSPEGVAAELDRKTPSTKLRLRALKTLQSRGFSISLHLDPIVLISTKETLGLYNELIQQIAASLDLEKISYLSLGVVRFPKSSYREIKRNYPDSKALTMPFDKDSSGTYKIDSKMRLEFLDKMKSELLGVGMRSEQIYFCME